MKVRLKYVTYYSNEEFVTKSSTYLHLASFKLHLKFACSKAAASTMIRKTFVFLGHNRRSHH